MPDPTRYPIPSDRRRAEEPIERSRFLCTIAWTESAEVAQALATPFSPKTSRQGDSTARPTTHDTSHSPSHVPTRCSLHCDDAAIARRPQTHPLTFTRGALQYAGNLRDHLLLIHGMEDDVVPFATSVALAEEFMRLGKTFDFAFAPAATHGWTQRPYYATYLMNRLVDHFDRYLGPGPR